MAWLFDQKRNPVPRAITHDCETPSLGRSYWIRIREFDDPHKRAFVTAKINDHIPVDLYIKLGQRKKNLGNPREAPGIPSEDVMIEIFR